ncbi:pyridoxal-phosphate dependent enzyme [Vibrio sp. 070316B]|uniref:threonine ammonia-lyase n=1 Tax=Vibrio sp. 070316B TaxID=2607608 RepID=UPI0014933C21|nr:pyridoxal-phosphate dependent enzyme [Vibrio sp. 070316B]NOI39425.1 pyridoxal-phosphate dependent enzyme [Vibrio sp. 070316B]
MSASRANIESIVYQHAIKSPLLYVDQIKGKKLYLKLECMQPTGSFKVRGAAYAMSVIESDKTIISNSAGNHAFSLSQVAGETRKVKLVLPASIPSKKLANIRSKFNDIELVDGDYDAAENRAIEYRNIEGYYYLSPYNDPLLINGILTLGWEIFDELEEAAIVSPIGGGGLCSGVFSSVQDRTKFSVYGVESIQSCAMTYALQHGGIDPVPIGETIAQGLAGNIEKGSITYDILKINPNGTTTVSDSEIIEAIEYIYNKIGLVVEPAGAVGLAALLAGKITTPHNTLVAIVSGRNVALSEWRNYINE